MGLQENFEPLREEVIRFAQQPTGTGTLGNYGHPDRLHQFSLLNTEGRWDYYQEDWHHREGRKFWWGEEYPLMASWIQTLGPVVRVGLNRLESTTSLRVHSEPPTRVRFHLAVKTNPGSFMVVDDERHHVREGMIWCLNVSHPHGAENGGASDRIHLIWDIELVDLAATLEDYAARYG